MADQYANAPEKASMETPATVPGGPVATGPPAGVPGDAVVEGKWSSGIFDCLQDPMSCLITYFAGCVSHGWVLNRLDGEPWGKNALIFWLTSPCCLHCFLWGPQRRLKFREKYGLPEEPASDLVLGALCGACILCQEWRELDKRGVPAADMKNIK